MERLVTRLAAVLAVGTALAVGLVLALGAHSAGAAAPVQGQGYAAAEPARGVEAAVPGSRVRGPTQLEPASGAVLTVCLSGGCGYSSIQEAVDAADDGDEIRVAAGTYSEVGVRPRHDITSGGAVTQVVYVSKTIAIRGGYTTTNWATPNPISNPTILDAQGEGRGLYITSGNGEVVSPSIEGLWITGGRATGLGGGPSWAPDAGGGIYVITATASISGCRVISNAGDTGGGVHLLDSRAALSGNVFTENYAGYGAALSLFESDATLSENHMVSNTAGWLGGGMYLRYSDAVLSRNTITGNVAGWGGGLYVNLSDPVLRDNTIASNAVAPGTGGGAHLRESAATIEGNLIRDNVGGWGGGLYFHICPATVTGNAIVANVATLGSGGGVYALRSDATVAGNTFLENSAGFGGAAYLRDSAAALDDNLFSQNHADYGGALYLRDRAPVLTGSTFTANSADISGGAVYVHQSSPVLINAILARNQAEESGSGLAIWAGSPRLLHTTLSRNRASGIPAQGDGAAVSLLSGTVSLTNTIVVAHKTGIYAAAGTTAALQSTLWGSGPWANGTDTSGPGAISHEGDFYGVPDFVDPDAGDYHLGLASAAIDEGVDAGVMEDVDGHPRPIGEGFDLGADESTGVDLSGSSKTAWPPNPGRGDVLSYSIVLVNSGPYSATDTVLFDRIPVSTTYVPGSAEATSGTFVGDPITEALTYPQGITWQGTVAPDVPVTVTFGVTVNKQTAIRNRAVITDRYGAVTELTALASSYRFYLLRVLRAFWPGRQWLYLPVIIAP